VTLFNKIQEVTKQKFKLEKAYFNGHTAAGNSYMHTDSIFGTRKTFLIYCNREWHPDLGGGTIFVNDDEKLVLYPEPGSAVCFPANIPHAGQPISKQYTGLRVSLAYKLTIL
jgi:hypothetical protein